MKLQSLASMALGAALLAGPALPTAASAQGATDTGAAPAAQPMQGQHAKAHKAKTAKHGDQAVTRQVDRLTKQLKLDDSQKAKITEILTDAQKQEQEARTKGKQTAESRKQLRSIRDDAQAKVRDVLNPEQQKKYDAMHAAHKAKSHHKASAKSAGSAPAQ